jgi:hypothetical protein
MYLTKMVEPDWIPVRPVEPWIYKHIGSMTGSVLIILQRGDSF